MSNKITEVHERPVAIKMAISEIDNGQCFIDHRDDSLMIKFHLYGETVTHNAISLKSGSHCTYVGSEKVELVTVDINYKLKLSK